VRGGVVGRRRSGPGPFFGSGEEREEVVWESSVQGVLRLTKEGAGGGVAGVGGVWATVDASGGFFGNTGRGWV